MLFVPIAECHGEALPLLLLLLHRSFRNRTKQHGIYSNNYYRVIIDEFERQIHRHGDRSPSRSYPNDPHINYKWPGGHGALLPEGSLQMFTLGKTLRNRYAKLLPSDGVYTPERILVMSSAVDRAQMSSQSLLAGFMPPPSDRNPLPISWQPIPVHQIPQKLDDVSKQKHSGLPKN